MTEYEKLELKIPHYMREQVNQLIDQQVKLNVKHHMSAFKEELDRELMDQKNQNNHQIEFYTSNGIRPGKGARLPSYPQMHKPQQFMPQHFYGQPHMPYTYGWPGSAVRRDRSADDSRLVYDEEFDQKEEQFS